MPSQISSQRATISFIDPGTASSLIGNLSGVFSWIGGVLGAIGIRSGTVHPNSTESNHVANAYADKLYQTVKSKITDVETLKKVGQEYTNNMLAYLPRVERWRNQDSWAPRAVPLDQINQIKRDTNAWVNPFYTIRETTRYYAVWSARNSDAQRPDDFTTVVTEDMRNTLIPAIRTVTGTAEPGIIEPGGEITPGTTGTPGKTTGEQVATLALFGGAFWLISTFMKK